MFRETVMQSSNESTTFFHSVDLEALSKLRSEEALFFSLYFDLRKSKRPTEDLLARFNNMLLRVEEEKKLDQDPPEVRDQWAKNVERIRGWLSSEHAMQGLGLAVLSSTAVDLWRVVPLPVPVLDRLVVRERPYLRPLAIMMAEFKCTLIVLMDGTSARLIESFMGSVQEIDRIQAEGGTEPLVRKVIERIEAVWQERGCEQLFIGGGDDQKTALRAALSTELQEHLIEGAQISPQADAGDLTAQVTEIEGQLEWGLETQRVDELLESAENGGAVLGLEQTMLAVRAGKVRLLIADQDYHLEGGKCPNCGFIGEGKEGVCLLCGVALRPEPDIIELALKRVLDQGGAIDVLRSDDICRMLAEHGRIGALLYEPGTSPREMDLAQQRAMVSGGEINQDAQHDETIEESFPASDPPGY